MPPGRRSDVRRSLFLVGLCVTIAALSCSNDSPSSGRGAIAGTVVAGPTCPVENAESPCPPRPWTGTVRATGPDGADHDAPTDDAGAFRIEGLAPGTYTVTAVVEGGGPPIARPSQVLVGTGTTTVTLQVDTGIR